MGPRPVIYGLVAGLIALALALPAGAAAAERTLTVHLAGAGEGWVECEVEGAFPEACEATYPSGTELTLVPEAELESEFAGFSGGTGSAAGCAGTAPCSFTLSSNSAVTATFVPEALPEFALTVKKNGTGTGTVECEVEGGASGPCASSYPEGTELRLIEAPGEKSEFVHWTGACSEYEELEECELTMEGPRSVTATFNLWPALTIHEAGTGSGSVTCEAQEGEEPCAATYPRETELILRATADAGSKFVKWSGCERVAGAECEIEMTKARAVTVTFDREPPGEEETEEATTGPTPASSLAAPAAAPLPPPAVPGMARAGRRAIVSGGRAAVSLSCSGGPCAGSLQLTARLRRGSRTASVAIGRASFDLAPGASIVLRVKLAAAAMKELERGGGLKAEATGSGVARSVVKLNLHQENTGH